MTDLPEEVFEDPHFDDQDLAPRRRPAWVVAVAWILLAGLAFVVLANILY